MLSAKFLLLSMMCVVGVVADPVCEKRYDVIPGLDCLSFWICANYDPIQINCPIGTRYSISLKVCVTPNHPGDDCQSAYPSSESQCEIGEYVAGDDCMSYRQCTASGLGSVINCSAGLKFSSSLNVCVWPGYDNDDCVRVYSDHEIIDYCIQHPEDVLPHRNCQQFYNCRVYQSDLYTMRLLDTHHSDECYYPQLFSTEDNTCKNYTDVYCGQRKELKYECDYKMTGCPVAHCIPCSARAPDCRGMSDGINEASNRLWTPYYTKCESERSTNMEMCDKFDGVFYKIFSPVTKNCEILYNIPMEHHGYQPVCEGMDDGNYLSIEQHPRYYFTCQSGEFVGLFSCDIGKVFSEYDHDCVDVAL
ncbi:hypothetical protein ScPMuIL_008152 [Solemya velum]